jgi:tetratricopeptide (TPR) repeat protein
MQLLGLNNDVLVGGRRFHVQTAFSEGTGTIVSQIFDNGRIVDKLESALEGGESNGLALPRKLKAVHQEMISEMEMLFFIADKVEQVKHPVSCNKLGLVFLSKNLFDDAIAQFRKAIELDNDYTEAHKNLGMALVLKMDYPAAEESLRRAAKLAPKYADLYHYLGMAQLEQKEYENALRSFNAALEHNPSYYEAHFNLARLFLRTLVDGIDQSYLPPATVRARRSAEHLTRAAEGVASFRTSRLEKAIRLIGEGVFAEAQDELDVLRQESPVEIDGLFEHEFYLKFMYGGKGKDDAFIQKYAESLRAAIQEYPNYADLHNNLGVAYLIQCRNLFLRALEEFRQAIKINPRYKRAEKNLKLAENDGKGFLILLRAILK